MEENRGVQRPLEHERLAALEQMEVLDSPSEPLFDSLTELAAQTFNTPIALISLVDQKRQWFKACVGLDVDHTAREISFCQYAILSDQVFVVLDAARDERFRDNPLVTGPPDIRFYAGAPLITPDGYRLGTLCVIDTVAREAFTDAEASRLQAIASSVMQALLMRLCSRERERIAVVADQQNRLLKLAEDMAGVGTWSWDVAADRTTWSDQVYRIHGYEPDVEPPALQGVLERYHPDDAKVLADHVQRAVIEGRDYALEARIYRPDGSERHVIARGSPRQGPDGAVTAILGTFLDVTELKLADENLRANEARLNFVMEQSADLIIRVEPGKGITWVSPSCRLYGYEPEDLVGSFAVELVHPDDRDNVAVLRAARFAGLPDPPGSTRDHRIRHKDGSWTWFQGNPTLIRGADGQVIEIVNVLRDVNAEREIARTLEATRDAAQKAAQVKTDFLANMSHEIRTPLTAILGFTDLLAGLTDLPDPAHMMVSRVKGASTALLSIVNDILDFSMLEASQMTIDPRPVDIVAVAEDALAMFGPQAEAKSLWLEFEASPDIPGHVRVDPDRLRQILLNLIGNAVKFTEAGTVRLTLGYDANRQILRVRVEDTGAGVDEAQRALLFQRFSQVDASSTRRHGGTGLGLAICKGLAEAMGGEIDVDSTPGQGSAFHFHIDAPPAASPIQTEEEPTASASLSGVRVLVADDNAANRDLARALLQQFGAEVTEAVDGAEVVAMAAEAPFDVILIDLHMPVLDGHGALHRIRNEPGPNQDAPIIAFTADDAGTVNCGAGGFDGLIGKPIAAADMIATLIRATQWQTPEVNHAAAF
jgi:PAS domain S-box-containing protein